jgi:hypothetical protein
MVHTAVRFRSPLVLAAAAALLIALPGEAAQRSPTPSSSGRGTAAERGQPASAPTPITDDADARDTRERLENILTKYPPSLGLILKLDPSLLSNADYVAPYPALSVFLAQHPEIAHNPSYFFSNVRQTTWDPRDDRRQVYEIVGGVLAGLAGFCAFGLAIMAIGWLIRTLINYRRWNRLNKIQTDVHTKLLDRFTASEDLIVYMQTPAGKRFLESAPIPLDSEARSIGAPLSRILWSVQVGVVLAAGALGLLYVSGRVVDEAAQPLFAVAAVGLALGAGFVVSAFVSYAMSRRLGLIDRPAGAGGGPQAGA